MSGIARFLSAPADLNLDVLRLGKVVVVDQLNPRASPVGRRKGWVWRAVDLADNRKAGRLTSS